MQATVRSFYLKAQVQMGMDWFCTLLDLNTLAKGVAFRCQNWYVHNDFNRSSDRFCEQEQNWGQYLQLKRTVLGGGGRRMQLI